MVFIKYQHVERVGSSAEEGLLSGEVYVFSKLDGSNTCAYLEDDRLCTMSRNVELSENNEFSKYVGDHPEIERFLRDHPGLRLYGEWMTPHQIKTYEPGTWYRWFVFDVVDEDCDTPKVHIPYPVYSEMLDGYGIPYIPMIRVMQDPTIEELAELANKEATFRMQEGRSGEGIVVKNYDFINRYGHQTWGKVINSEFTAVKSIRKEAGSDGTIEERLAAEMVTPDLVAKEYAKLSSKIAERAIPGALLKQVYRCVMTEELFDAILKHREPTVNFRTLRKECANLTKMYMPDLYGMQ